MVLMVIGGGFQLNTPAGLAYLRARSDGCPAGINSATRSYSQQLDWYLNQGKKGYPAKADNPARSKHVWRPDDPADKGARALDLPTGGPQEWMRKWGAGYGWMKDRVSGEKWHFEYEEWNDPGRGSTPSNQPSIPTVKEDEEMSNGLIMLAKNRAHVFVVPGVGYRVMTGPQWDEAIKKLVEDNPRVFEFKNWTAEGDVGTARYDLAMQVFAPMTPVDVKTLASEIAKALPDDSTIDVDVLAEAVVSTFIEKVGFAIK